MIAALQSIHTDKGVKCQNLTKQKTKAIRIYAFNRYYLHIDQKTDMREKRFLWTWKHLFTEEDI